MKNKENFNVIGTGSENKITSFSVLSSGVIVEYVEKGHNAEINHTEFISGRVITPAVPNGVAFTIFTVYDPDIIGEGKLLNPKEDVRAFEEQAANADRE